MSHYSACAALCQTCNATAANHVHTLAVNQSVCCILQKTLLQWHHEHAQLFQEYALCQTVQASRSSGNPPKAQGLRTQKGITNELGPSMRFRITHRCLKQSK